MLQRINGKVSRACQLLGEADSKALFPKTLEFSAPARGTWNIVHTGMLVPEAHQIYICAAGCLRGVILTAAEMGAANRFSTIELLEKDLLRTDNEKLIIDGVSDILNSLPKLPPAVLLFTACFHHFMGTNLNYVYSQLRQKFPTVDFAECIMDPIRQSKSITPEERERREIYRLWSKLPLQEKQCNILSSNLPLDESSDIIQLLKKAGYKIYDMPRLKTYAEFLAMASSRLNIYTNPFGHKAALDLKRHHQQGFIFMPQLWNYDEIATNNTKLANMLDVAPLNHTEHIALCQQKLHELKDLIGNVEIAIDMTLTFCPFSLAKLLLTNGFNVTKIYSDTVSADDKSDFIFLQENYPYIELWSTKNPDERILSRPPSNILCLGQKAAYFNNSPYFIEYIDGGGHYGFDGIIRLADDMRRAFLTPKDTRKIISKKANGGPCCYEP